MASNVADLHQLGPALLPTLLEQIPFPALLVAAPSGRLLARNSTFTRIVGEPPPADSVIEYLRQRFRPVSADSNRSPADHLDQVFTAGLTITDEMVLLRRADGRITSVLLSAAPVRDAQGSLVAGVVVCRDAPTRTATDQSPAIWVNSDLLASLTWTTGIRIRDNFLSTAAHELRTPLTTISGFSQLLQRQLQHPELDRDQLMALSGELRQQVARMVSLVDDLMQVLTLQDEKVSARRQRCDVVAVAHSVAARARRFPEHTDRHEIVLDAPENVNAFCNAEHLDQILSNLLSNGLKYSPGGGVVRVDVRSVGDQVDLTISDQGIGMTPRDRARVWQPFVRFGPLRRSVGGTGLGLYVVRNLVERNAGTVSVESTPGEGTSFTVRIPRWSTPSAGREREPS